MTQPIGSEVKKIFLQAFLSDVLEVQDQLESLKNAAISGRADPEVQARLVEAYGHVFAARVLVDQQLNPVEEGGDSDAT